jgi:hypothetical protein
MMMIHNPKFRSGSGHISSESRVGLWIFDSYVLLSSRQISSEIVLVGGRGFYSNLIQTVDRYQSQLVLN